MALDPAYSFVLNSATHTTGTISGDVMWEAGAGRYTNGRRDGADYFAVRIYRIDFSPPDHPWLGTIQITTINKAGVEIDEDLVGESTSDSVGPIGVYNINLVRGLDYKFQLRPAAGDPSSLRVCLEFYS